MAFRIRPSKFRHVYGEAHRKERCYENVRLTRNAHDSNFCAVNPKYLAIVTESSGGGSFVVLPISRTGRTDINAPKVCGHAGNVLDIKWSPFRDNVIASGSEDNTVKIWQIPDGGLMSNLTEWQVDLHGHGRRVGYIEWHPVAENIILSAGLDYKCIIWNVEQAEPVNVVSCHPDLIQSISWNRDGSMFSTTCKDKVLRLIDPRAGTCVSEAKETFKGVRPSKSVFLGDTGRIFCSGFNTTGERELAIWDIRNLGKEIHRRSVDCSNGILMPYYDHDTKIVFLAGKGDGNIRYYEMTNDAAACHFLSSFGSASPQRGLGVMPKRGCDTSKCEIMRFYKLHAARNFVEPVSMIVPRKSNLFHDDIFVPTASAIPSLNADEWISGQNRDPILISMKDHSVVSSPQITPSRACQPQDGALNQAPVITTYKAMSTSAQRTGYGEPIGTKPDISKVPASLKNIKLLSTGDDIINLNPPSSQASEAKPDSNKPSNLDVQSQDKAFVNSKIAAFENKGNTNNSSQELVSPTRKKAFRSWSNSSDPPPDVIANGIKSGHERSSAINPAALNVQNAAQFFEHKEIEIIDIKQIESKKPGVASGDRSVSGKTAINPQSSHARLILGDLCNEATTGCPTTTTNKIHVKKTWSPMKQPDTPSWDSHDGQTAPNTDPERSKKYRCCLRKAYFQQAQEIKALKEQVGLKDKRIRQLEDELSKLRNGQKAPNGESDC